MPSEDSVAAVIPVKNRPALLERAIHSIQAQTTPIAEIIIVDDASTDNTPEVVLAMAEADPRIKLLRQPRSGGASAARNLGWRNTNATWIAFLDSDDEWLPTKIEKQLAAVAAAPEVVGCYTGVANGDNGEKYIPPASVTLFELQRNNVLGTTSTALVRRTALEAVGGFDSTLPSCQDWDVWLRLRAEGPVSVVREPLVRFEQVGLDRITKNRSAVLDGHAVIFTKILGNVPRGLRKRRVQSAHAARMAQIMLDDFQAPSDAIGHAARSMFFFPNRWAAKLGIASLKAMISR